MAGREYGRRIVLPGLAMAALSLSHAVKARTDPRTLFNQAVALDLNTTRPADTEAAFALYRQAADGGLAEAQLNAAVMLDSGRGTVRDGAQAADWYAAAATGGVARAAFDLGQLYESGDGVPQNAALARAWFSQAASEGLAAAANRPVRPPLPPPADISPPATRYPHDAAQLPVASGGLALVWTAQPTPASAEYFVQVMQLEGASPTTSFSTTTVLSAARMPSPRPGRYVWRVFILCPSLGRYVPSGWASFSVI